MFDVSALKDKIIDKIADAGSKIDEKDMKGMKEHLDSSVDGIQKKASDTLKTADKIIDSPEVGAIGSISGPQGKNVINKGKEIIQDANKSPVIVGKNRVASFGQPGEFSML